MIVMVVSIRGVGRLYDDLVDGNCNGLVRSEGNIRHYKEEC